MSAVFADADLTLVQEALENWINFSKRRADRASNAAANAAISAQSSGSKENEKVSDDE